MTPRVLGRDQILGVDDLPRELVDVPEWDGSVWTRSLNAGERARYWSHLLEVDSAGKIRPRAAADSTTLLASMGICDDQGQALFSEADVAALARKSSAALDRVAAVIGRLSGIGQAEERVLGNSEGTPSADSS